MESVHVARSQRQRALGALASPRHVLPAARAVAPHLANVVAGRSVDVNVDVVHGASLLAAMAASMALSRRPPDGQSSPRIMPPVNIFFGSRNTHNVLSNQSCMRSHRYRAASRSCMMAVMACSMQDNLLFASLSSIQSHS